MTAQNDLVLYGRTLDVEQLVHKILFISWRWFFERHSSHPCSHYEWVVEPSICWDQ